MKILVSNIGSTSFKFRLFEIEQADRSVAASADGHRELASGGADRIGQKGGVAKISIVQRQDAPATHRPSAHATETSQARDFADHGQAISFVLEQLVAGKAIASLADLGAVAFKAVMAGDVEPVMAVDDALLERMEYFVPVAPAHNPAYIAAMRMFRQVLPGTPLVAAFEPGFHRNIPSRRRLYAVPREWADRYGVKRYGYHGASHAYIAYRTGQLMPAARRVISCHLGGSSSICAIEGGKSVATSMGLSPQSGLPQSNRCGEFDAFAMALLERQAGLSAAQVLAALGSKGGLAAMSGTSGDIRDILAAIAAGSAVAREALDVYVTGIRDLVGAYLVELGGADAIVFTGGIGQHNPSVRAEICQGLEFAGIRLEEALNAKAAGEVRIDSKGSSAAIWVMPTNEELIVARQAAEFLRIANCELRNPK